MAQHLSELCALIVDDLYGELSSKVFLTLMEHGRLTLRGLIDCSHLSEKLVKHGLVVLIQQHLVLHSAWGRRSDTYYEANWVNAYALVRSGKIIKDVQDRFGESAAGLISNLILLGHARVKDLADAYGFTGPSGHKSFASGTNHAKGPTNGDVLSVKGPQDIKSLRHLHSLLTRLHLSHYIISVSDFQFLPAVDIHNKAEEIEKRESEKTGTKGKKLKEEIRKGVRRRKRKWRDSPAVKWHVKGTSANGKRLSADRDGHPRKRVRVNGHLTNGASGTHIGEEDEDEDEDEVFLDEDLMVRVNHEKFNVILRSEQLVDLAARHIGEVTSKVYRALLSIIERRTPRCFDELAETEDDDDFNMESRRAVTTLEVARTLDANIDLSVGIGDDDDMPNGTYEVSDVDTRSGRDDSIRHGTDFLPSGPSRARLSQVARHLKVLAADPRQFTRWVGSRGHGEWDVDFEALSRKMIQNELEKTIRARFGNLAARVVRILQRKGKLDEKVISDFALIKPKDVRYTMTNLQEAGLVETQEVPRDQNRLTSRAMFFWFFDREHCRRIILGETYKAMARLLQRARFERTKVQAVIDKAERTDVVGNEDQYLSTMEKNALRSWREVEEKLLTQLARQDDLVAVLRDFAP